MTWWSRWPTGLPAGEVAAHLAEIYDIEVSRETISNITDRVLDGLAEWQSRPLDPVYPVIFIDVINVKIRDGQVANRPVYVALAVTADGERDVLGLWAGAHGDGEGAKYWLRVLTEIRNRGVADVCIVVCDGLKGLPDAISTVWPQAITQTCIVHYPDIVVMPIPGRKALAGGGERPGDIGIIRGLRGRREAGRAAGSGPAGLRAGWSGRVLAA
jgi:transposase-like protein